MTDFRMKELEDDAIRAQAVIVKAQELQNEESKQAAGNLTHLTVVLLNK